MSAEEGTLRAMKWSSALGEGADMTAAIKQAAGAIQRELGPRGPASLVVAFAAASFAEELPRLPALLRAAFPDATLLGCSASGIIGNSLEVEGRPGVSLTAAHLPGVRLTPFRVGAGSLPTPDDPPEAWRRLTGLTAGEQPHFLMLMDPFFEQARDLLAGFDFAFPGALKVGGIASGGRGPGANALFLDARAYQDGAVGVALQGAITVETVVAQGCRPIGTPQRVTRCHKNLLLEVEGQAPLAYLQKLYPSLDRRDRELISHNLFLGIAMDALFLPHEASAGDFLIRNIIGADQQRGILAIGEALREGQLVQFHVRDGETSAEDLERQMRDYREHTGDTAAAGALLFQCSGRGRHLYGRPHHDSELFKRFMGDLAVGGFFCNGEIGPVGGTTYLHGYTSCFAIFRSPAPTNG